MEWRLDSFEGDGFFYPDISVCCVSSGRNPLYKKRPKLVVEVLSQDENRDLIEKTRRRSGHCHDRGLRGHRHERGNPGSPPLPPCEWQAG
jgi:hypothetical protein